MTALYAAVPYLAPLALLIAFAVARTQPGQRPARALAAARWGSLAAFAAALASAALLIGFGPATSPLIGFSPNGGDYGLSARLDALSVIMLTLVSFVGMIVVQFSRNYLDGDPRQGAFMAGMALTLAAVTTLVISGNLIQLVVAWICTSLALHQLLVFYKERKAAQLAAYKKWIVARIGDAALIVAAGLLIASFGTGDIAAILADARAESLTLPGAAVAAAALLAFAAFLKSAQFPTHGWLTEVMETPTPVSALLHAGIINAGGFLIVRFADVMLLSMHSLHLLALIGGFTALFGSVVMLTQTTAKGSLAYSTVAQMGFMLLQCGFGAFSVAVLHIVAHSLYKAHAFLSAGSAVDRARAAAGPDEAVAASKAGALPGLPALFGALAAALAIVVAMGALFGASLEEKPAVVALGAVLVLGLAHLLLEAAAGAKNGKLLVRGLIATAGVSALYFALQAGAAAMLDGVLPAAPQPDALGIALMALAVVSFAAVAVLQATRPAWEADARGRTVYTAIANGLYANALFNKLVGALDMRDGARS